MTFEKIERYLLLKMTPEEQTAFESAIEQDASLKEQVLLHKALYNIDDEDTWIDFNGDKEVLKNEAALFRSKETSQFTQQLRAFKENQPKATALKKSRPYLTTIAATAAILIAVVLISYPKQPDLQALYTSHASWDELPSLITKGNNAERSIQQLEYSFQAKDYDQVVILTDKLLIEHPEYKAQILLYSGVSLLEMNENIPAIARFDMLIESNSIDAHKGYWYKALSFLKQGDKTSCIETLKIITQNSGYYKHSEAKKLLRQLD